MSSNADIPSLEVSLPLSTLPKQIRVLHRLNCTNADSGFTFPYDLTEEIKLHTDQPSQDIRLRLKQTPTTTTNTNSATDDRTQTAPAPRPPSAHTEIQAPRASVTAQCSSHAASTPLWRKHNEKTVCDICGMYYELYAAHPIPMKSDIVRKESQSRSDDVALAPPVSHRPSPAPDSSPTLAPDSTTVISYEFGKDGITTCSEFVGARGLTDMNDTRVLSPIEHVPIMSPRSTKGRMSKDCDTIHRGLPLHNLVTNLEDVGFQPQPGVDGNNLPMAPLRPHSAFKSTSQPSERLDLGSMSPGSLSQSPENIHPQPRSESNSDRSPDDESRSFDGDLNSQLKEHAGLELALTAVLATVSFSIVCSEGKEDHLQVCLALGVLRPISLLLHFGAALTTCAISQNGGNGVSSRCLRLFWTVLFGLALISIIFQVSLYTWTAGNLVTSAITALLAILCSLPGFYLVSLKWYRALQHRRVEG